MAWEITGNAGTSPNANFIGTTDWQALVVKTNNAECMRVTAEGRVGIGVDSPEAGLHVKRDIEMGAGGPKAYLHLGAHDETKSFFGFGTDYLYLNGSQGTFGAFDSSGRLGLGTWTPEKTLHVLGAAQVNGPLDVLFGDFRASDNACLATRLGSVGIGTDSPQAKLHVVGDARIESVGGTEAYLHLGAHDATSSFIGFSTDHLNLHGPHGTFGVFSSSGRLGLGVDSPEADLHVKRDIMMGGGDPGPVSFSVRSTGTAPLSASVPTICICRARTGTSELLTPVAVWASGRRPPSRRCTSSAMPGSMAT